MKELGDLLTGKGGITWSFSRGAKTGPTPIQRQIMRRGDQFTNFIQQLTGQGQGLGNVSEETIMEKKNKSFKDLTKKIPGYYDGKPAPLGFPMNPPPETINGYHPDLVTPEGQKKQAKRFNRLDPQSAKAMPPTGNPHIDKKVRVAAKKPK